ncbi:MAG: hypothetical protein AB7F59_13905 [Bdellovibrionales bacterium]
MFKSIVLISLLFPLFANAQNFSGFKFKREVSFGNQVFKEYEGVDGRLLVKNTPANQLEPKRRDFVRQTISSQGMFTIGMAASYVSRSKESLYWTDGTVTKPFGEAVDGSQTHFSQKAFGLTFQASVRPNFHRRLNVGVLANLEGSGDATDPDGYIEASNVSNTGVDGTLTDDSVISGVTGIYGERRSVPSLSGSVFAEYDFVYLPAGKNAIALSAGMYRGLTSTSHGRGIISYDDTTQKDWGYTAKARVLFHNGEGLEAFVLGQFSKNGSVRIVSGVGMGFR